MAANRRAMLPEQRSSPSMQIFIKRVNLTVSVLLVAGLLFSFVFVYLPLNKALQDSLLLNFAHTASLSYRSMQSSMERGLEGARSLSSRTMIKEAIIQHEAGNLDLDQLKKYSQSEYEDGARALDYLLLSKRYVNDQLIASYQITTEDINLCLSDEPGAGAEIKTDLCLMDGHIYYVVVSPILHGQHVLGYDKLVFDLAGQINQHSSADFTTQLLLADEFSRHIGRARQVFTDEQAVIYKDEAEFFYTVELPDSIYYISSQGEYTLFAQIRRLSLAIFIVLLVMLAGFTVFVYFYVISYAEKEILSLEQNTDALRNVAQEAQIDPLTKAGSRRYGIRQLEAAFADFQKTAKSPLIMLLDIDSMKKINDSHGHAAGDLVLETLVAVIRQNIRVNDSLIRWGGDEFIAIFTGLKKEDSLALGNKIQRAIRSREIDAGTGLILPTVSIGLSYFIKEDKTYNEALKRADQAMYNSKALGGNTVHACWLAQMA